MTRARLRDLGIEIGLYPTGPLNAITDVPGVLVSHATVIRDAPRMARTGLTVIEPRAGNIWHDNAFAGLHVFNGNGELTGMHWINETGVLCYPIVLTSTCQVGGVHAALIAHEHDHHPAPFNLPVVGETSDDWLNDSGAVHLTAADVESALANVRSGPVPEGNVGGGTGMICYDFKGGIGTASRMVAMQCGQYTVGALVQANHGDRLLLRVDGVPVGRLLPADRFPTPWPPGLTGETAPAGSSILVIIATDAPLLPMQCRRLAQRATIGLARTGGVGYNGSGDLFLAISTGNHLPTSSIHTLNLAMLPNTQLNLIFEAVAEAVEEAILNALTAAETMTGYKGRTAQALPLAELQNIWASYARCLAQF